jgi:hypothetical protein
MGSTRKITAVLTLLLFVLAGSALAQSKTSGAVQGTVKDADGAVLPGVTVTAYSDALVSGSQIAVTDERGVYRFPSLPVGNYRIEASLSGFNGVKRPGVRIALGQTLTIDLAMAMSSVNESITVTAEAPIVSVAANSVATNFDSDYLETAPLQRNFYTIIKAAPGVNADLGSSGSAMLAYGGTSESQNAFTMDGVNVADAGAGQHWILPSIQWMEEIQIGGLGANAEYGGYTGGVINGVTKSGGNELSGGLEYYYQPDSWVSDNDPENDNETFKFSDISASLGGKLVQDKLWFFVSGEIWQQETTPLGASDTSDRRIPRALGKLTFQQSASNRFALMVEHDAVTNERRGISDVTWAEASSKQDGPGTSASLSWEGLINANNFASARITGYDGRDDYLPYHGSTTPGRIDEDTGVAWVNQDIRELNHRSIKSIDGSWNMYRNGLFGKDDTHDFKFGGLYETAKTSDVWRRNGGFTYYDDSSTCDSFDAYLANPACGAYYVERGWGEYDSRQEFTGIALYAQDSMRINRLTVNYGVRYGSYDGGWQEGHGDSSVYDASFVDPRFGIVYDLRGDARSAIKVHWGRYHDKMYGYLYDREASGGAVIPDQDCYWNEDTGLYDDCDTPTTVAARMGATDHAYVDESLLSFEQQLGADMVVGVDFVNRGFRNIMAMVNENDDYSPINVAANPFGGGNLTIYRLNSQQDWVLTTDNGAYRDFQSLTGRFEKRYSKGWSARASLVWTDLEGNIRKNNGYAPDWADLNGSVNRDGRMDYAYSEWEGKFSGAIDLPFKLQLSGQFTYLSGWYWTPYVRVTRGLGFNARSGRDINLTERGSEQMDDRNLVDLRLAWNGMLPNKVGVTASLEVFNAFNSDTVIDVYNRWGSLNASSGAWSKRSDYGTPYLIESPRQLRAGVRLTF